MIMHLGEIKKLLVISDSLNGKLGSRKIRDHYLARAIQKGEKIGLQLGWTKAVYASKKIVTKVIYKEEAGKFIIGSAINEPVSQLEGEDKS
jgi:uncharacterized membrane protein